MGVRPTPDIDALRASERHLRLVIDSIPALVWCARPDGTAEFFNQHYLDYLGLPLEAAKDWGWTAAVHADDRNRLAAYWQSVLASGQQGEIEARIRRSDGAYRWFLFRANPMRDESGNIVKWYGTNTDIEDRKRAEEELRGSEELHRIIFEAANDAVISIDARGTILLANPAAERIFGYGPMELIGQPLTNLMPEYLRKLHEAGFSRYQLTGERHLNWQANELTGLRKNNVEFPVEVSFGEIEKNGHRVFTGFIRDTTEKKWAEEALRASEKSLRMIVDSIPGLICVMTREGQFDLANRKFLDYTGKTLPEMKDWPAVVHPDDLPAVVSQLTASLETGCPFDTEVRLRSADSGYRWFQCCGLPLRDADGQIIRWYKLLTDIEDRKCAESALRASERDLSSIIEAIPALVWCAAPDGEVNYLNGRMLDYTGTTPGAWQRLGWTNFLHPDDVEPTSRAWSRAIATGQTHAIQCRLRRSDGVYRWFQVLSHPARNNEGGVTRWYGLLIDFDDQKKIGEALRNTQERLSRATQIASVGELSASIAHEINQPLAAALTNSQVCLGWLSAAPPNAVKAQAAAERAVLAAKDAGEVVRRIRALFKRASPDKVLLDLNEVIGEVLRLSRAEAVERRVEIESDLAAELTPLAGDRVQLQQLIQNLLFNGFEAMEPVIDRPRKLVIRSRQDNPEAILVEIQDNGVGMREPDRIFDAFYTTKENGMGMGLAICRSIVEAHHGRLWTAPGGRNGAIFCFTLPTRPHVDA